MNLHTPLIPGYELLRPIKKGSFGQVWMSRQKAAPSQFRAVKVVAKGSKGKVENEGVQAFLRSNVRHANLVDIEFVDETDEYYYYVTPLADDVNGKALVRDWADYEPISLELYRRRYRPVHLDDALTITRHVLMGVGCLHSHGRVHCDIKPDNVLRFDGVWKIADPGILQLGELVKGGRGTPWFIPPEGVLDRRADLYATGKMLYLILSGRELPGVGEADHFKSFLSGEQTLPCSERMLRVKEVILIACNHVPDKRFPDAASMFAELNRIATQEIVTIKVDMHLDSFGEAESLKVITFLESKGFHVRLRSVQHGCVELELEIPRDEVERFIRAGCSGEFEAIRMIGSPRRMDSGTRPEPVKQSERSKAESVRLHPPDREQPKQPVTIQAIATVSSIPPNLHAPAGSSVRDPTTSATASQPEFRYNNLFRIASRRIPYIPLFGSWKKGENEYHMREVAVEFERQDFKLPEAFRDNPLPRRFQEPVNQGADSESYSKCRFIGYHPHLRPPGFTPKLTFVFAKTNYLDYLKSGELLDTQCPDDPAITFRDEFAPVVVGGHSTSRHFFGDLPLTNSCGVGIFIITSDNMIIVSRESALVTVFPSVLSYTASGTMDWNRKLEPFTGFPWDNDEWQEFVNPFSQAARECWEEVGHIVNTENVRLFGLGIDAKKLYFQFSFYERTSRSSSDIIDAAIHAVDFHVEKTQLLAVPFNLGEIVRLTKSSEWEPSAEVAILTLCVREFGLHRVEQAIDPSFVRSRWKRQMIAEWKARSERPRDLAVGSIRYPETKWPKASEEYARAVMRFIGSEIDGKSVLEVGCGSGRITELLVARAGRLTCIDLSQDMIEQNRARLGEASQRINYHCGFAQDFQPDQLHDVAICSLVLIHNVDDDEFVALTNAVSASAKTIFLFEHVDEPRLPHPHTCLRPERTLVEAFSNHRIDARQEFDLFGDRIVFLKLTPSRDQSH